MVDLYNGMNVRKMMNPMNNVNKIRGVSTLQTGHKPMHMQIIPAIKEMVAKGTA